jgi:TRAP transporter TAXI family solute receptor
MTALGGGVTLASMPSTLRAAFDEELFMRTTTGPTSGTYFPVGGVVATAISNPPGSRECRRGGICGVPGLIAVAHSSPGSVANVENLEAGLVEAAFCQNDVAHWAFTGQNKFEASGPVNSLRAITRLFPEPVHIVVATNRWFHGQGVRDLKGLRISIDLPGSGTHADALLVLEAHGLSKDDLDLAEHPPGLAADLLAEGELDGFFLVSGAPATAVTQLAERSLITLVPLDGEPVQTLKEMNPFLTETKIPAGTYFNVAETDPFLTETKIPAGTYFNVAETATLSVDAQWLVAAVMPEEIVYKVTEALWDRRIQKLIRHGHTKGAEIKLRTALEGVGTPPLHPGAERYYLEQGFIWVSQREEAE